MKINFMKIQTQLKGLTVRSIYYSNPYSLAYSTAAVTILRHSDKRTSVVGLNGYVLFSSFVDVTKIPG